MQLVVLVLPGLMGTVVVVVRIQVVWAVLQ
jgi:hypothetical protein